MDSAVNKLITNCYNEVGYSIGNSKVPNKKNKYANYLDSIGNIYNGKKNGYDWCDIFVDYMFIYTYGVETGMQLLCQSYNGLGAGCTYSARYYKNKNRFNNKPEIGSQIFFTNDNGKTSYHTGIVVNYTDEYVYTIEGNVSNSVAERKYLINDIKIMGYGHPDWSIVKTEQDRYLTIEDIPDGFYRDSIKTIIDKGYLVGKDNGVLDLSDDMIRTIIICGRMCGVL